jgi:hypothetical protein
MGRTMGGDAWLSAWGILAACKVTVKLAMVVYGVLRKRAQVDSLPFAVRSPAENGTYLARKTPHATFSGPDFVSRAIMRAAN